MEELRLKDLESPLSRVACNVESPTPGVVLVEVGLGSDPAPLHWRAGSWDKPPLDISMDASGRLLAVQFVLQDEWVERDGTATERAPSELGRPVFDVSSWPDDRYLDVEASVTAVRTPEGTLVLRIGEVGDVDRVVLVGEGLAVCLRADALVEVRIGPLDVEDWEAIDAFSSVPGQL